ncbi:MAG: hypothetical protein KAS36_03815 [Anaerolineales bacterium]|nr:hypothetical protein [Anaerolineales bacterium]
MSSESERRFILEMIQSGKISSTEGLNLLKALTTADEVQSPMEAGSSESEIPGETGIDAEAAAPDPSPQSHQDEPLTGEVLEPVNATLPPGVEKWRRWWRMLLWVGVTITILGGLLMYWAQQAYGIGFWFICAWVPFLLGLALMVMAWQSRTARWIHIRVHQRPGEWPQKIALSFPIPLRMTAWFLRVFGGRIPGLRDTSVDELIVALGDSTSPENPLFIEVEDDEDGERVEIFIG